MKLCLAPGPHAPLHVGNARIALLTWLLARRHGGTVVLRLGDLDPRTSADQLDAVQHDLRWLGLDWDTMVRQSDRRPAYDAAIQRLKDAGRLYPCFESDDELRAKQAQRQRRGQPLLYDRAMLNLTAQQRAAAEASGKRPYWRFLLSGVPAQWGDMVLGRQAVKLSAVSDPVLVSADGTPQPLLTAALDDVELGVTHTVHGEDHLTATAIETELRAALSARPAAKRPAVVRHAHIPLMAAADGTRLRRTGALSLRALRADGIEPPALAGLLSRLGTPDAPEPLTPGELAPAYDLSRISRTQPRFDPARLLPLNRRALATLPFEAARDRLPPSATPAFWHAVRGSLDLLREARGWWDVVGGVIVPPLLDDESGLLSRALDLLPPEPWDGGTWSAWVDALGAASGRPTPTVLPPLRLALTGEDQGPDLQQLLPLIGRARVTERLTVATSAQTRSSR